GLISHDENVDPRQRSSNTAGKLIIYGILLSWLFLVLLLFVIGSIFSFNILSNFYSCMSYRKSDYNFLDEVLKVAWDVKERPDNFQGVTVSGLYSSCKEAGTSLSSLKIVSTKNATENSTIS